MEFDKSKPYAVVCGSDPSLKGAKYQQNGFFYAKDGTKVGGKFQKDPEPNPLRSGARPTSARTVGRTVVGRTSVDESIAENRKALAAEALAE